MTPVVAAFVGALLEARGKHARRVAIPRGFTARALCTTPDGKLHEPQYKAIMDDARYQAWMASRRGGKTTGLGRRYALRSVAKDRGKRLYLALTGGQARDVMWEPVWKPLLLEQGLSCEHNETRMLTTFANGSIVKFGGTDDIRTIKKELGAGLDEAAIDECFPAGTLVDGRPIESLRPGDVVICVNHATGTVERREIRATMSKVSRAGLVTLVLRGRIVCCTPDHPVFAKGRGYVHAKDLRNGDLLCVRRTSGGAARDVQPGMPGSPQEEAVDGECVAHARGKRPDRDDKKEGEPHAQPGNTGQGECGLKGDRAPAENSGRKWHGDDRSAGAPGASAGGCVDRGIGHPDEDAARVGVSDLLQAGPWESSVDDVYRGRWSESWRTQGAGREENVVLEWARLEGDPIHEPGSAGVVVYNLDVDGAHTYFANGVLVHNCQDQPDALLTDLAGRILSNTLTDRWGTLILMGVVPEVEAGFWWDIWSKSNYSKHNFSQMENPFLPHAMEELLDYLAHNPGLTIDSPIIQRERFGRFKFDRTLTAYTYTPELNGYAPELPEWFAGVEQWMADNYPTANVPYLERTQAPASGAARFGLLASVPHTGITSFAASVDQGRGDRVSINVIGWGSDTDEVQHVAEYSTPRKAQLVMSQIAPVMALFQLHYDIQSWSMDGVVNELDTLDSDYGIGLVRAPLKADMPGQVRRQNDLLTTGKAQVMEGSATEEDLTKARWNKDARAKGQYTWASQWHPDPSESWRYAHALYHSEYVAPEPERPASVVKREKAEKRAVRKLNEKVGRRSVEQDEEQLFEGEDDEWT